jgi:hypothetical protein
MILVHDILSVRDHLINRLSGRYPATELLYTITYYVTGLREFKGE